MESRLDNWRFLREVHSSPAIRSGRFSSTSAIQINFRFDQINSIVKEQVQHAMNKFYKKHTLAYRKLELLILEELVPHLLESSQQHDRLIERLLRRFEKLSALNDDLQKVSTTMSSRSTQNSIPSEQVSQEQVQQRQSQSSQYVIAQQQEQDQQEQELEQLNQEPETLACLNMRGIILQGCRQLQSQATRDLCVHFMPEQCSKSSTSHRRSRKRRRIICSSRTTSRSPSNSRSNSRSCSDSHSRSRSCSDSRSRSNSRSRTYSCSHTSSCNSENQQGRKPTVTKLPPINAAVPPYVDKKAPDNVKEVMVIYHNSTFKLLPIKHADKLKNPKKRMVAWQTMQQQDQPKQPKQKRQPKQKHKHRHPYIKCIKPAGSMPWKEPENDLFELNMMVRKSSYSIQMNRFKFPYLSDFYNLGKNLEKRRVYDPQKPI